MRWTPVLSGTQYETPQVTLNSSQIFILFISDPTLPYFQRRKKTDLLDQYTVCLYEYVSGFTCLTFLNQMMVFTKYRMHIIPVKAT